MDKLPGSSPEFRPDLPQPNSGSGYGDEPSTGRIKSVRGQRDTRPSPSQSTLKGRGVLGRSVSVPGYKQRFMTPPPAFHMNLAKQCNQYLEALKQGVGPDDFQGAFTPQRRILYGKRQDTVVQAINKLQAHEPVFLDKRMMDVLEEVKQCNNADEVMDVLLRVKNWEFTTAYRSGDQKESFFTAYLQMNAQLLDVLKLVAPDFEEGGEFMAAVEDAGIQAGDICLPPHPKYERTGSNYSGRGDSFPSTPTGDDRNLGGESDFNPGGRRPSLGSDPKDDRFRRRGSPDSEDGRFGRRDSFAPENDRFRRPGSSGQDEGYPFGSRGNKGSGGLGEVERPPYGGRGGRDEDTRSPYATGGPTLRDHEWGAEPSQSGFGDLPPYLESGSLVSADLSGIKGDISKRLSRVAQTENDYEKTALALQGLDDRVGDDEDLKGRLAGLKDRLGELRSGVAKLKDNVDQLQLEKDDLKARLDTGRQKLNDVLNEARQRHSDVRDRLMDLDSDLEILREKLKLSPADELLRKEFEDKQRDFDKLNQQLEDCRDDVEAAFSQLEKWNDDRKIELDGLRRKYARKFEDLAGQQGRKQSGIDREVDRLEKMMEFPDQKGGVRPDESAEDLRRQLELKDVDVDLSWKDDFSDQGDVDLERVQGQLKELGDSFIRSLDRFRGNYQPGFKSLQDGYVNQLEVLSDAEERLKKNESDMKSDYSELTACVKKGDGLSNKTPIGEIDKHQAVLDQLELGFQSRSGEVLKIQSQIDEQVRIKQSLDKSLESLESKCRENVERLEKFLSERDTGKGDGLSGDLEIKEKINELRQDLKKSELEFDKGARQIADLKRQCGNKIDDAKKELKNRAGDLKSIRSMLDAEQAKTKSIRDTHQGQGGKTPGEFLKELASAVPNVDISRDRDRRQSIQTGRSDGGGEVAEMNQAISRLKSKLERFEVRKLPNPISNSVAAAQREVLLACSQLESSLKDEEKKYLDRDFSTGNVPPSKSELRSDQIRAYKDFKKKIAENKEKLVQFIGSERCRELELSVGDRANLKNIYSIFTDCESRAEHAEDLLNERQSYFDQVVERSNLRPPSAENDPDEIVSESLSDLKKILSEPDAEARDYLSGELVVRVSSLLADKGCSQIEHEPGQDRVRSLYDKHRAVLCQLLPEKMPSTVHPEVLGVKARPFIKSRVNAALERVEKAVNDRAPKKAGRKASKEVMPGGKEQARRMIEDERIRPFVLSLVNSLKDKHEHVEKGQDYYAAADSGLKKIRDAFKLHPMPCMHDVLIVCLEDLEGVASKLASEAEKQHGGSSLTRKNKSRQDKLKVLCTALLNKEKSLLEPDSRVKILRLQPDTSQGSLDYPHERMMKAFRPGGRVLNEDQLGREVRSGSIVRREVAGDSSSPLNAFFDSVDGAEFLSSEVTGDRSIQIVGDRVEPEGLIFKQSKSGEWQVNLGNSIWSVDPCFLYDHPHVKIPFEDNRAGAISQDWLPLKNAEGKTAIIALRKTPQHVRYFLYEKSTDDTLKPKVIGKGDPRREKAEASFFYKAACGEARHLKSTDRVSRHVIEVHDGIPWMSEKGSKEQLTALYGKVIEDVKREPKQPPVKMAVSRGESSENEFYLSKKKVRKSVHRQIQENKRNRKDAIGASLTDSDPGHFAKFSVEATFDQVGDTFLNECQARMRDERPELQEAAVNRKAFRQEAFQKLTVYKGCELNGMQYDPFGDGRTEGSPPKVQRNLEKVIKVNRDHQLRLSQGIDQLTTQIAGQLRKTNPEGLKEYRDDELIAFAISEFEDGRLPKFTGRRQDQVNALRDQYTEALVDLILAQNDLAASSRIGGQLKGLRTKLDDLIVVMQVSPLSPDRFRQRCQELNLEMALVASEQKTINERLDSYSEQTLESKHRVVMSFERGGVVLRGSQTKVVGDILDAVQNMDKEPVKLVYQLGTGYGKSKTVIPITVERALRQGCPVRVIAPVTNQAELDISLQRYFAQKGIQYRTLDIMGTFARGGEAWWLNRSKAPIDNLDRIHNLVLGMDPETPPENRNKVAQADKGPVGISVRDVQILMQLRNRLLLKENPSREERVSIEKLDAIADDLVRDGMNVFDEWDRTAVPNRAEELNELRDEVNSALAGLFDDSHSRVMVNNWDIIRTQGAFLFGCKNKLCLSATTGTSYAAALLSGSKDASEVRTRCNSDPLTTIPRFWHWMNKAAPVFSPGKTDMSEPENREQVVRQVVDRFGPDRQMILFDGNDRGDNNETNIKADFDMLAKIRKEAGVEPRSLLFYDQEKRLCMYLADDPKYDNDGKGAPVSPEEEDMIRANPAKYDVRLDRTSAVGIDPPQVSNSVGVHFGMYEDPERRLDVVSQEVGRFSRKSDNFRCQDFVMVVDISELDSLEENIDLEYIEHFSAAHEKALKAESQLKSALGVDLKTGKWPPEYKKSIVQDLEVPVPDRSQDDLLQLAEEEIKRVSDVEWSEFPTDVRRALEAFKLAQWEEKREYLMMTAAVFASREVSPHTKSCEKFLKEGAMDCEADRVLAEEHAWLDKGVKESLKDFSLDFKEAPQLKGNEAGKKVNGAMKRWCEHQLEKVERRKLESGQKLEEVADSTYLADQVKSMLEEIKTKPIPYVDGEDYYADVRPELQACALAMCRQAEEIYSGIMSEFQGAYDLEALKSVGASLKSHIDTVKGRSQAAIDACMETEKKLKQFYQQLVLAVQRAGLPAENKGTNTGLCKRVIGLLSSVVSGVDVQDRPSAIHGFMKDDTTGRVKKEKVKRLVWPSQANKAKDVPLRSTPLEGSEKLRMAIRKAEPCKAKAQHARMAEQFCNQPASHQFKTCIEEIKRELLRRQNVYIEAAKKEAREAELRMLSQGKLMQVAAAG